MKKNLTACAKISNLCIQAFGERPDSVTFEFPADGLFQDLSPAAPCSAALINGLLGRSADCLDAETAAAAAGIAVSFKRSALPCHPNYRATVHVTLRKGKKCYYFDAACTNNGEALVYIFDRVPVHFSGDCYEFLIFIETYAESQKEALAQTLASKVTPVAPATFTTNGTCWLIVIPCANTVPQSLIDELNKIDYVQLALQLTPVQLKS